MEKVQYDVEVKFGDKVIDSIEIAPLTFVELAKMWEGVAGAAKPAAAIQRARIKHQTHFKCGKDRIVPDEAQIGLLPITVAKTIIAALDEGQGEMGEVLSGDGVVSPVLYKLGAPIHTKGGKGEGAVITELEFQAKTYADVEDVLAADNEISRAEMLLRNLAAPVGVEGLMRLPEWAIAQLTVADGVAVMRDVLPRF